MESGNFYLVLCLTILIGVGVPGFLYLGMRRGGGVRQMDMMRRATQRASKPWEHEDKNLEELSQQVEKLRQGQDGDKQ